MAETLDELRAEVAQMRELGVIRWKNILLGPPPAVPVSTEPETDEQRAKHAQSHKREYFENLLNRPLTDEELDRL